MTTPNIKGCPACTSMAEEVFFNGVFITCSKTGCGISTGQCNNIIDAHVEWDLIRKYYPKPVPEKESE